MHATLSSKGQITLPKALREQLHLSPGDRIEFIMDENGAVRMIPKHLSIHQLKGILPKPDQPVSLDTMQQAIEEGASGQ